MNKSTDKIESGFKIEEEDNKDKNEGKEPKLSNSKRKDKKRINAKEQDR